MSDVPDILKKILARKTEEISERNQRLSLAELRQMVAKLPPTRPFRERLEQTIADSQPAIIAEIKRLRLARVYCATRFIQRTLRVVIPRLARPACRY